MAGPPDISFIGYQFMGQAHSKEWLNAPPFFFFARRPVLCTLAGRTLDRLRPMAERWGWKNHTTRVEEIFENPEIDLVDIGTPNNAHPELVIAAAESGKAIACEKPLARTYAEARPMMAAVKKAKVKNYVW